ncbi:phage virion morphogenesis protein [Gilvimarinus sp. 1_MG-2023]|uniref:phage virion morphogenesis protein n=1 Tax=Gilvimarinus sp. 1_MG-2023 TaxID=3062638 RepID=UPI0026E44240|nr:phage virion morphogenesis protein [Gilvimarinus sp. 1_MG-2023]MDO6747210.1 phage virion morphogenesis protein [Gilvimarinus sp. 1_MG-2023]
MSISFELDAKDVNALIDKAMRFGKTKALMERTGRATHTDTMMNFRRSMDPFGNQWAPITHRKGKPLIDTRRMQNSVHMEASDEEATVGTNVKYAAVHNFGATIKPRKGRFLKFKIGDKWVYKKSVVIPARQFLGFGPRVIRKIERETSLWAEEIIDD